MLNDTFFVQSAYLVAPVGMITDPCCVFKSIVKHLGFYVNSEIDMNRY